MTSNDAGLECNNQTIGCQDGLVCNNDTTGICVNLCQHDADCTDASCRVVQYCDKVTGECSDTVQTDRDLMYTLPEVGKVGICMHLAIDAESCGEIIGCATGHFCDTTTNECVAFNGSCTATAECTMGTECQSIAKCGYADSTCVGTDGPLVTYFDVVGGAGTCSVMNTEYGSPCNDSSIGCVGIECHLESGTDGICGERCAKDDACTQGVCTVPLACDAADLTSCTTDLGEYLSASKTVTKYTPYVDTNTAGFCMTSSKVGAECNNTSSSCEEGHYCRDGTCIDLNGSCQSKDDCVNSRECYIVEVDKFTVTYKVRVAEDETDGICMSSSVLGSECDSTSVACDVTQNCSDPSKGICFAVCTGDSDCTEVDSACLTVEYCAVDGSDCVKSITASAGYYMNYLSSVDGYCMKTGAGIKIDDSCDSISLGCGPDMICSAVEDGICTPSTESCGSDADCSSSSTGLTCTNSIYCSRDTLKDCRTADYSSKLTDNIIKYSQEKPDYAVNGWCSTSQKLGEACDGYSRVCGEGQVCSAVDNDAVMRTCVDMTHACSTHEECIGGLECLQLEYCGEDLACFAAETADSRFIKYVDAIAAATSIVWYSDYDVPTGSCMIRAPVEEPCDKSSGCEDGLVCSSVTEGHCVKMCNSPDECGDGERCIGVDFCSADGTCDDVDGSDKTIRYSDRSSGNVAGTCMFRAKLGEGCDSVGLSCDLTQLCDWSDHFETKRVCTLACESDADCESKRPGTACFDVSYCAMDGTCTSVIADSGSEYYMTYTSGSIKGYCMEHQNIGKICEEKTQSCYEGYACDVGVCWALNRSCKADDECVAGRTCQFLMYCADDSDDCSDDSHGMNFMEYVPYSDDEFGVYSIGHCLLESSTSCDNVHKSCASGYRCDSIPAGNCVVSSGSVASTTEEPKEVAQTEVAPDRLP